MSIVSAIDHSAVANFVRDNIWVYPLMLTLHAIGLAFAPGVSVTINLRVLGVASALPLLAYLGSAKHRGSRRRQPWRSDRPTD